MEYYSSIVCGALQSINNSEFPINLIEPVYHIIYYVEQNFIHRKLVRICCQYSITRSILFPRHYDRS